MHYSRASPQLYNPEKLKRHSEDNPGLPIGKRCFAYVGFAPSVWPLRICVLGGWIEVLGHSMSKKSSSVQKMTDRWLLSLFGHLVVLLGVGVEYLVLHLVRYLLSMSSIVHGKQHPLHVVADSLIKPPPRFLHCAADSAFRSISTTVKSRSEPPESGWTCDITNVDRSIPPIF